MFNVPSSFARGTPRGHPGLTGVLGRRLAVALTIASACLLQTGCQSGPFSPCGSVRQTTSRFFSRFHRDKNACCGSEVVADGCATGVPVEGMVTASPTVTSGPIISTTPQGGTSSSVAPGDSPTSLDPIAPEARPGPAPGSIRRSPGTGTGSRNPTGYDSQRPDYKSTQSHSNNLAHTLVSTPAPATRSAQVSAGDAALDNLPPLDLPGEVTEKTATPPVAPAAERKPQNPATAGDPLGGRSPRESDLGQAGGDPTSTAGPAPGIDRFAAVDLRLAGGSAPSPAGLDWLAEKGYKTLVDLRPSSEVNAAFIAEAARRGLRYIALPIGPTNIDRDHVSRFNFELASSDARPLYFFDATGTRAGALWYVRRITVDQVSSQVARREAVDLGCAGGDEWLAATAYLDRLDSPRPQAVTPAASPGPAAAGHQARTGL